METSFFGRGPAILDTARARLLLLMVLLSLSLIGCEDKTIQSYQAPKAPPYTESQFPGASATTKAPRPTSMIITWDTPEGWAESPNSSGILFAVYTATGDTGDVRITVTQLTADGGGVLSNINRWRGQVGLKPVADLSEQPMVTVQVSDLPVGILDLVSPDDLESQIERMLVAMMPRPEQNTTWYFKMTGPKTAIDTHKDDFSRFVESVRFVAEHTGHDHTAHDEAGQDATDDQTHSASTTDTHMGGTDNE